MAQIVEETEARAQKPDGVAALEGIDIRKSLRLGRDRIDILNGIACASSMASSSPSSAHRGQASPRCSASSPGWTTPPAARC